MKFKNAIMFSLVLASQAKAEFKIGAIGGWERRTAKIMKEYMNSGASIRIDEINNNKMGWFASLIGEYTKKIEGFEIGLMAMSNLSKTNPKQKIGGPNNAEINFKARMMSLCLGPKFGYQVNKFNFSIGFAVSFNSYKTISKDQRGLCEWKNKPFRTPGILPWVRVGYKLQNNIETFLFAGYNIPRKVTLKPSIFGGQSATEAIKADQAHWFKIKTRKLMLGIGFSAKVA